MDVWEHFHLMSFFADHIQTRPYYIISFFNHYNKFLKAFYSTYRRTVNPKSSKVKGVPEVDDLSDGDQLSSSSIGDDDSHLQHDIVHTFSDVESQMTITNEDGEAIPIVSIGEESPVAG